MASLQAAKRKLDEILAAINENMAEWTIWVKADNKESRYFTVRSEKFEGVIMSAYMQMDLTSETIIAVLSDDDASPIHDMV